MAGTPIEEVVADEEASSETKGPKRLKPSELTKGGDKAAKDADDEDRAASYKAYQKRLERRKAMYDNERSNPDEGKKR